MTHPRHPLQDAVHNPLDEAVQTLEAVSGRCTPEMQIIVDKTLTSLRAHLAGGKMRPIENWKAVFESKEAQEADYALTDLIRDVRQEAYAAGIAAGGKDDECGTCGLIGSHMSNCPEKSTPPTSPQQADMVLDEIPEEAWGGLARDIMMALDMNSKTPRQIFGHLKMVGTEIPQWLRDEAEMQNLDHVISKGTRCVIIYKAMREAMQADMVLVPRKLPPLILAAVDAAFSDRIDIPCFEYEWDEAIKAIEAARKGGGK